jgi:hypothetical protein
MNEQAMVGAMPETLAAPQLQTMPMPEMAQMPQAAQPRRGGGLRNVAGVLGDMLSTAAGGQARFLPNMMQERDEQRQLQLRQQMQAEQRAYEESQWRARQDYERNNPAPDAFTRSLVAAGIDPNSEEGRRLARQRAINMADPMQTVNNGDGTFTLVRPSQFGQPAPQAAPSAPDTLPSDFDFGGPTPTASGGFR